jgi:hypothetical protein
LHETNLIVGRAPRSFVLPGARVSSEGDVLVGFADVAALVDRSFTDNSE